MRRILFYSLVLCTAGCGSDSNSPEKAAGISLSISNPASGSSVEKAAESVRGTPSPSEKNLESPAVRQLIQKANAAVVAGQHRVAIEAMSQAIGQTPEDANLYRIRADVYVLLQEMANAHDWPAVRQGACPAHGRAGRWEHPERCNRTVERLAIAHPSI